MNETLVEIRKASAFIPGERERPLVLRNISLSLEKGGHAAILGPNGSGKSSLLKLIHGDLWPCSGSISWRDRRGVMDGSRIAARELCALVSPEGLAALLRTPWPLSAGDFLEREGGGACAEWRGALWKALDKSGLSAMFDQPVTSLSQGRLSLLALFAALLRRPSVLLLDEWADNLDPESLSLAMGLLDWARADVTMIFTSHREAGLPAWIKSRLYIKDGALAGPPNTEASGEAFEPAVPPASSKEPLFALSGVSVYVEGRKVLENINWSAALGEHWLITGANGSGKSTFLRLLAGDEFAALGGVARRWNPVKKGWMRSLAEARAHIALVSALSEALNDYPLTALELVCTGYDNTADLRRGMSAEERAGAMAMLKEFFPEEDASRLAGADIRRLSSGQARRLYLARAMLARPSALLLDEPLNGLDAESRRRFLAALHKTARANRDFSIIMVSHYPEDAPPFITRRAALGQGRLTVEL